MYSNLKYISLPVFMFTFSVVMLYPGTAYAMHIMEGFLPGNWSALWYAMTIPFFALGLLSIRKIVELNPKYKMLLAFVGAFAFALSALKIPSLVGSCSHPTGMGLGAILFGPLAMVVLGSIVLLFQALLLAHGGITTLGANVFSMAVVGPFVAYGLFKLGKKLRFPIWLAVFLAAALGDLMTYVTTSFQLALAYPDQAGGLLISFVKFLSVFAVTQTPLAVSEGLLTVLVFNLLSQYSKQEMNELLLLPREGVGS